MSLAVMKNLLSDFGAAIGIPDLEPDADHRCNMMFDDVAVSFELGPDDESLYIYALLGSPSGADPAAAYRALLRANYAFAATAGATLSLDRATDAVVLVRAERLESLRLPRLEAVVEDFVNAAERWTARLRDDDLGAVNDPAEAQDAPAPGTLRV